MKKQYWLALGWGAARWFIHIGVIKYIEENNFNITEVSWTSMWAIIAALYAVWKTSEEIIEIAKSINFIKLIDFDFKEWLLKWIKVSKYLQQIFWEAKFSDTKIKLRIVATNVENWEKKVFKSWFIVDAIRASISLPWIFKPHKIWKQLYIDWWIVNNLPIEVLDEDNIIAVSALKKVNKNLQKTKTFFWINFRVSFLNLNFQILQRTIILMMKQNEDRSLNNSSKQILFIYPDYKNLDFYSFNKIDQFVDIWYKEFKKVLKN